MRTWLVVVASLATLAMAHAAELAPVNVEYSADSVIEAEGITMRTRVFHAPNKERREINMRGQQQIMILRMDKRVSWMLMPEGHQYMEMPIGVGLESSGDLVGYDIQRTAMGKEKVNGLDTTKYKTVMNSPEGFRLEGFMWVSTQGIVVKMEASSSSAEHGGHMRMELSGIRLGKQDPKLFEIPAGYDKLDLNGFGGLPDEVRR